MNTTLNKIAKDSIVVLSAFSILIFTGCSQKGEDIYRILVSNIQKTDSYDSSKDAFANLDSLKKINPKFHKADTTISSLEKRINIVLISNIKSQLRIGAINPNNIKSAYGYVQLINRYSPDYTISEDAESLSVSKYFSRKALAEIKETFSAFGVATFWSLEELHAKVQSDSGICQAYSDLLNRLNQKEDISASLQIIEDWKKLIPIKAENTKKEIINRTAKHVGTYIYKESDENGDFNNSIGGLSERKKYSLNKDGSVLYVFDHDGNVNGVMHYAFTVYKDGIWKLTKESEIKIDYKKLKVIDHGSTNHVYGYWKSAPQGRGIWINCDEVKDDDPENSWRGDNYETFSMDEFNEKFKRIN